MEDAHPAKRAILIAGPTASGKSALALALAEEFGGTIINADSMQVYADLRILTARPSDAEMARVPHRLFGHVDAAEAYSVGRWLEDVRAALDETRAAGRLPILVGGTGLYIKALIQGLSDIPAIPDEVRSRVRADMAVLGAAALHNRLQALDPAMANRLKPSDQQRISRAIEVHEATGRSLACWQNERQPALLRTADYDAVFLDVPRRDLYDRIDRRFDVMMESGALDEAKALALRRLPMELPAMRALGVTHLISAADNRMPIIRSVEQAKAASRHYAKRQITFARHQWPTIKWVRAEEAPAMLRSALATPDL